MPSDSAAPSKKKRKRQNNIRHSGDAVPPSAASSSSSSSASASASVSDVSEAVAAPAAADSDDPPEEEQKAKKCKKGEQHSAQTPLDAIYLDPERYSFRDDWWDKTNLTCRVRGCKETRVFPDSTAQMVHERSAHKVSDDTPLHPGHSNFKFQKADGSIVRRCHYDCAEEFTDAPGRNRHEQKMHGKPSKKAPVLAPEDRKTIPCPLLDCNVPIYPDEGGLRKHLYNTSSHHDRKELMDLLPLADALKEFAAKGATNSEAIEKLIADATTPKERERYEAMRDLIADSSTDDQNTAELWGDLYRTSYPDNPKWGKKGRELLPPLGLGTRKCEHGCGEKFGAKTRLAHRKHSIDHGCCTKKTGLIKAKDTNGLKELYKHRKNRVSDPNPAPGMDSDIDEPEDAAAVAAAPSKAVAAAAATPVRSKKTAKKSASAAASVSALVSASASSSSSSSSSSSTSAPQPLSKDDELRNARQLRARLQEELGDVTKRIRQLELECGVGVAVAVGNPNNNSSNPTLSDSTIAAFNPLLDPSLTPSTGALPMRGASLSLTDVANVVLSGRGRSLSSTVGANELTSNPSASQASLPSSTPLSPLMTPNQALEALEALNNGVSLSADPHGPSDAASCIPVGPPAPPPPQSDRFAVHPVHDSLT